MEGKVRTVDHVQTVLDLLLSQQLFINVPLLRGNRGALIKRANEHVQYLFWAAPCFVTTHHASAATAPFSQRICQRNGRKDGGWRGGSVCVVKWS